MPVTYVEGDIIGWCEKSWKTTGIVTATNSHGFMNWE
jgi:hypothetical protein